MGRIRIHESRAASGQLNRDFFDVLFALAPDRFALGDTSDVLIVEFTQLQQKIDGHHPPGFNRGVFWLLLDQVVQFFPIKADDAWTFEGDADKARVAISAAVFEPQWEEWSRNQMVNQACMNGLALCRSFGLGNGTSIDENELSHWRGLALRSSYPSATGLVFEDIQGLLLKSTEGLFDLVREDSVKGSIFVSGPIEWINLRSNTNILQQDHDFAEQAHGLHEKYWSVEFDPLLAGSEDISMFTTELEAKFPDMFPRPWSPALIALHVRYSHLIKYGSVNPDEIIAAVNAINSSDDQSSAQLLAFLFGVSLGANKVHDLDRLLHPQRYQVSRPNADTAQGSDPISTVN
ncbi:hypothetical protein [Limnohabitans parvus]|uniref:hypothetical protein n=1 Tax=Limnohabitans parvus TaxID=540061 RepID=UPI0011B25646|nr:hypothetical protein [Limnohabitans parvus]